MLLLFLMIRRTPRSTRTYTRFPYTTRFRSTYASPDTIPSSGSLRRMARGPVAVGIPGWTTALAGTEGTRVQGESEYRCTMGSQAARRPQSTGTDRKSGVLGNGVSVSVDHGGRRILKKKTKHI